MEEKGVVLRYKNVEIEAKVEMTDEDMTVFFWNPNSGNFSEYVDQIFSGWSFQEENLNDEMEKLIGFVKNLDEQYFADAEEGEVYIFDDNGYPSS